MSAEVLRQPQRVIKELVGLPLPDKEIDPGIQNLVLALNLYGLKTHESCEGHRISIKHSHPWVGCWSDVDIRANFIEEFNLTSETKWTVLVAGGWQYMQAMTHKCKGCFSDMTIDNYHLKQHQKAGYLKNSSDFEDLRLAVSSGNTSTTKEELEKMQASADDLALFFVGKADDKISKKNLKLLIHSHLGWQSREELKEPYRSSQRSPEEIIRLLEEAMRDSK